MIPYVCPPPLNVRKLADAPVRMIVMLLPLIVPAVLVQNVVAAVVAKDHVPDKFETVEAPDCVNCAVPPAVDVIDTACPLSSNVPDVTANLAAVIASARDTVVVAPGDDVMVPPMALPLLVRVTVPPVLATIVKFHVPVMVPLSTTLPPDASPAVINPLPLSVPLYAALIDSERQSEPAVTVQLLLVAPVPVPN